MAYTKDEIRSVLVQTAAGRLLLPNANVAEVLAWVRPEPVENAPTWLLGRFEWHGWQVPLVSFAPLAADYSRHSRTKRAAFWGSALGYGLAAVAYYTLGVFAVAHLGATDVLGALLAIVVGLVVAGHVRKKRRAAQRAAVAAAVTLDAGAAAGEGGNGWTAGASRPAVPFSSSASASSASPDSDADSPEYRGRHLR